ncbi:MAG: DUF1508 domain-containing protein [Candidatus Thermoplasmatota archaeon]
MSCQFIVFLQQILFLLFVDDDLGCMMKHLRKSDKTVKKPRFEYGYFREDEWIFQLKAADGSLLLQSDPYASEEDCLVAIEHIKMNSCLAYIVRVQSLEQY